MKHLLKMLMGLIRPTYEFHDGDKYYVDAVTENIVRDYRALQDHTRVIRNRMSLRSIKLREQHKRIQEKNNALDALISGQKDR
jgi:hypothetical protein